MNGKLKQFIAFGVCAVVALAICLGTLAVTVNNLEGEKVVSSNNVIVSKTELENSDALLINYFNDLTSATKGSFIKTKAYTDVFVDGDVSVLSGEKDGDRELLNFAKGKILPMVDSFYPDDTTGTFADNNSKMHSIELTEEVLEDCSFSIGLTDGNGESIYNDEGKLFDEEFYYLTFEINGNKIVKDKILSKMFSVENDLSAKNNFTDAIKENCVVQNSEITPLKFIINAKVNRISDKIEYINVTRRYDIISDVSFINKAQVFGEKEISFTFGVTDTYEYSYAGISFVADEITISQGEEQILSVNAVIDDDSEYTVEFISSDEAIASVDEMGYVKALKNCDAPAVITVKLKYLGEIFTDTCKVNVTSKEEVLE